jgi:hypothetical protein
MKVRVLRRINFACRLQKVHWGAVSLYIKRSSVLIPVPDTVWSASADVSIETQIDFLA